MSGLNAAMAGMKPDEEEKVKNANKPLNENPEHDLWITETIDLTERKPPERVAEWARKVINQVRHNSKFKENEFLTFSDEASTDDSRDDYYLPFLRGKLLDVVTDVRNSSQFADEPMNRLIPRSVNEVVNPFTFRRVKYENGNIDVNKNPVKVDNIAYHFYHAVVNRINQKDGEEKPSGKYKAAKFRAQWTHEHKQLDYLSTVAQSRMSFSHE